MNFSSMRDELRKIAEDSNDGVAASLQRLDKLEKSRPSAAQIARGALAGTAAGAASSLARGLVKGDVQNVVSGAMKAPTLGGKLLGLGAGAAKGLGATAAGSATLGATLPFARQYLERSSEEAKIRGQLGLSSMSPVRQKVRETLGVG